MKTKIMFLIVIVITLIIMANISFAYPSTYSLSVPKVIKEKSNWCWAACIKSTLWFLGDYYTQSEIVYPIYPDLADLPADIHQVENAYADKGYVGIKVLNPLSFLQVVDEIYRKKRPIYCACNFYGYGHAVILDGYDDMVSKQYIEYMDPDDGQYYIHEFSSFYNDIWKQTFYKIQTL